MQVLHPLLCQLLLTLVLKNQYWQVNEKEPEEAVPIPSDIILVLDVSE